MHGRVQRHSESCKSLRRCSSQPMRSLLPSTPTVALTGDNRSPLASSITTTDSGDSFFKVLILWVFQYCLTQIRVFSFLFTPNVCLCFIFAPLGG